MRQQSVVTALNTRIISNVIGGPIEDVRIPGIGPFKTFATYREFASAVWPCLDMPRNRDTLKPLPTPLIERYDVPIVFSHGDLLPKNLIVPVSKEHWLRTREPLCIIDWECAGWKPLYWEVLRATFFEYEPDTEWTQMMREVFPECRAELDADWRWRSEAGIPML